MGTMELNTLDPRAFDDKIRRDNLRLTVRNWIDLRPGEFTKAVDACRLEWGEGWFSEVMR